MRSLLNTKHASTKKAALTIKQEHSGATNMPSAAVILAQPSGSASPRPEHRLRSSGRPALIVQSKRWRQCHANEAEGETTAAGLESKHESGVTLACPWPLRSVFRT